MNGERQSALRVKEWQTGVIVSSSNIPYIVAGLGRIESNQNRIAAAFVIFAVVRKARDTKRGLKFPDDQTHLGFEDSG